MLAKYHVKELEEDHRAHDNYTLEIVIALLVAGFLIWLGMSSQDYCADLQLRYPQHEYRMSMRGVCQVNVCGNWQMASLVPKCLLEEVYCDPDE
ncbi:MAG TPA: hypothetical protein VMY98_07280 [Anaerolineae bacterium]|nr:hypothetical protein [Anaerolineae bacterium]